MKKELNRGVTLIALIITIIVLLILAGITLAMVMGENGIFGKANKAREETNKSQAIEEVRLKVLEVQTEKEGKATLKDVVQKLKDAEDTYNIRIISTEQATLGTGITTVEEITDTVSKIGVTNTKYGYEVEIGKNLAITNQVSSNTGGTSGGNSGGNTGGSQRNESSIITQISASTNVKSSYVDLEITTEIQSGENVKAYFVYVNNKLNIVSLSNKIRISDLTMNTDYRIVCEAFDSDGNSRKTEEIPIKTLAKEYIMATNYYPIITATGIKNVKYVNRDDSNDYYYDDGLDFNLNENSYLASDAIKMKAYDNESSGETYEGPYYGNYLYLDIDSSAWGKTLKITKVSGYQYITFFNGNTDIGTISAYPDRGTSQSLVIPTGATRFRYYFSEGGKLYNMKVE